MSPRGQRQRGGEPQISWGKPHEGSVSGVQEPALGLGCGSGWEGGRRKAGPLLRGLSWGSSDITSPTSTLDWSLEGSKSWD